MFERFTDRARRVVVQAQRNARERHAGEIRTEHLLLALYDEPGGVAWAVLDRYGVDRAGVLADVDGLGPLGRSDAEALARLGIDLDEVRRRAEDSFGSGALDRAGSSDRRGRRWGRHIPFEKAAKKALELALREARQLGHNFVGTEHILLGLLAGQGSAGRVLAGRGLRLHVARATVNEILGCRRRAS